MGANTLADTFDLTGRDGVGFEDASGTVRAEFRVARQSGEVADGGDVM
jgi:hypothetical protein